MKWFRFYHEAIDDPKVQRLEPVLFKFWVNMLCLASRSDERGTVQLDVGEIAFALRITDEEAEANIAALMKAGLLEEGETGIDIHNWNKRQFKSDDVSARVAESRKSTKQGDPEDETLHETPTETLPPTLKPSARDRGDTEESSDTETEAEESENNARPKPRRRKHQVPDDFTVTDDMRAWVADKMPHLPASVVGPETEKFLDYYGSTGEARLDWVKSWRNWMRRVRLSDYSSQPTNVTPFKNSNRNGKAQGWSAQDYAAYAEELERQGQ